MNRVLAIAALILSLATFFGQTFFFTRPDEQILCGVVGVAIYALAMTKVVVPPGPASLASCIVWAAGCGIVLGLMPPEIRVGRHLTPFVIFFPLVHATTLFFFFRFGQRNRTKAEPPARSRGPLGANTKRG